jgi:hypothetical protein
MSENGVLKSGDFPECPVCKAIRAIENIARGLLVGIPPGDLPSDLPGPLGPPGTGLFKMCYEDEVFLGPIPDIDIMTQLGYKTKFLPGIMQMAPLVHPTKPPLLAAVKIKMLLFTQEICEVCGTLWMKHWEIREVIAQAQVQGPPGMPPGRHQMNPGR